jgi:hypothetical protein
MEASPLYCTPRTPDRRNFSEEGMKLAKLLGIELQPWQVDAVALLTETDPTTGHWAFRDASLLVGRQNGKSLMSLILLLIHCFATPGTTTVYGAQTLKDSRAMLLETWQPLLDASPLVDTYTVRAANGSERIMFKNKSSIQLLTTTSTKAGHGRTIDYAILDEAFSQPDARVEQAVLPAMATRSEHGGLGSQYLVISNAGTLDGRSPYLWDRVERGRQLAIEGITTGSAYVEWSAPDGVDPADPAVWAACTPALGHTITEEAIRTEFESMERAEFQRARLCQWTVQKDDPVISIDRWNELQDDASKIESHLVFALDVAPNRDHASIVAAGRNHDGLWHVEVVESRSGTDWVAERLQELWKQHSPLSVVVDQLSSSLVPELSEGMGVTQLAAAEHAAAFAYFVEQVTGRTVRHPRDDDLINALMAATTRPLGDGGMAWSRRGSSVDIDSLVAVTLALWAAESKVHAVGIWSLDEVVAERHNQQPAEPEPTEERAVSGVKRTLITDMLPARRYAVSHQPDTPQYPTSPPDIGTPRISTETS